MCDPSAADTPNLTVRVDGCCGTIILRRPTKRNALSRQMVADISQALGDLHQQQSVRGVVLTGAGDAFCSGTDLSEIHYTHGEQDQQRQWFQDADQLRQLLVGMLQYPKPLIASVNGTVRGSGMGLMLACDIVLSSPSATFGFPEGSRGLTAGVVVPLLAFRIGAGRSAPLLLQGEPVDAGEAHRLGLVHELVEDQLLWARAEQITQQTAHAAVNATLLTKRVLNEIVGESLMSQLSAAAAVTATARTTSNAKEGVAAWVQKRDPIFDVGDE